MKNIILLEKPVPYKNTNRKRFTRQPELLSIWGKGQLLAFSGIDGQTDSVSALCLRTRGEMAAIEIKMPHQGGVIMFDINPPVHTYLASDHFTLQLADGSVVRGVFADCRHLLIEGPAHILGMTDQVQFAGNDRKILIGVTGFFDQSILNSDFNCIYRERADFLSRLEYPYGISRESRQTLAKAYSMVKNQIYSPEGLIKHRWSTPDRWPHHWMWLWDSTFHALGMRHVDPQLAKDCISAVFDCQQADGFIPHCMRPDGSSDITQPPILGLGISAVMEVESDMNWLAALYPKLSAYLKWVMKNRDNDGAGLVEWDIEEHVNCRSGESGMDNSSRFDAAIKLDAPDFNAYLAADCEIASGFAEQLGLKTEAAFWKKECNRINRLINKRLWNDELKFYMDYDIETDKQGKILSSAGFLPLLSGAPSQAQARELVRHLSNPETFGTPFGVPSISRNSAGYSKDMWRGPVWININYLIIRGLERYGYVEEAGQLRDRTLREIEKYYLKYGTFFEYYDDRHEADPPELLRKAQRVEDGKPYHQVLFDYGWTATLYIDMLFNKKSFSKK